MQSTEYRGIIKRISQNAIKKKWPGSGIKPKDVNEVALEIARAVHARLYGANVSGVESPLWRDNPNYADTMEGKHPTKTAQELLDHKCGNV